MAPPHVEWRLAVRPADPHARGFVAQQERWDVALKVLNGPLASMGEQVMRGPVVRIGANPGPGGFDLGGYRGLDARQCVITAYSGGSASVAPVGTNQVRLAPHPNVNWRDIDPISGPEYLTPGCAVHLGPIGRGATLEFVECRRLGVWQKGRLASEAADVPEGTAGVPGRGPLPAAYDARRVGRIRASYAPIWFVGCMFLMALTTTAIIGAAGIAAYLRRDVASLGPVDSGYEFYDSVQLEDHPLSTALLEGLEQPYYRFVMEPNIRAAGAEGRGWEDPAAWDSRFYQYVSASVEQHVRAWSFFQRLEAVRVEYAQTTLALRQANLPEIFAAIPYQESRYRAAITSEVCAEGWWQFMPEVAYRLEQRGMDFRVANCRFLGSNAVSWSPSDLAPPRGVRQNGAYMDQGVCMIERCNVDDRKDLAKSTAAALFTLREAWDDPLLAESGSAVQLTITSHNAGYDDGRFGAKYSKPMNVKPAYKAWVERNGADRGRFFVGENIRCRTHDERSACAAAYMAETQHYAYTIAAQHILAVCYYAKNYGEEQAFNPWRFYVSADGYCKSFNIPTKEAVRARGGGKP